MASAGSDPPANDSNRSPAAAMASPAPSVSFAVDNRVPPPLELAALPPAALADSATAKKGTGHKKHKNKKAKKRGKLRVEPLATADELQARLDENPEDAWVYEGATITARDSPDGDEDDVGPDNAEAGPLGSPKTPPDFVRPLEDADAYFPVPRLPTRASISSVTRDFRRRNSRYVPMGFQGHNPGAAQGFDLLEPEEEDEEAPTLLEGNGMAEEKISVVPPLGNVKVTVMDYSATTMEPVQTFRSAAELSAWLDGEEDVDLDNDGQEQPQHRAVRWINVEGIDVATIRVLGLHYQLHPLAIEDFTTFPPLIKVDYYSNLLFMNLVLTALDDPHHGSGWFSDQPDVEKPEELHRYHRLRMWQESAERQGNFLPRKRNGVGTGSGDRNPGGGDKNMGNYPLMYSMRAGKSWAVEDDPRDRMRWCNVAVKPVAFFLHRSSTLISIFAEEADEVVVPVVERLLSPQTLLRKSEDVSFLMEALLDGIVDRIVEVVEEYADELENMERKVFRKPKQIHTRQLHLILLELHALRRVLTPLTASVEQMRHSVPKSLGGGSKKEAAAKEGADEGQTGQFRAVSRLTQFYLGDVLDHLKFALEELSTLETRITDLTSLIFNTISHEQNRSMRLLSLVSLIFLPLTFVAGIYGMNFDNMPELTWEYGYEMFYVICFFSVLIIFAFFTYLEWRNRGD